jgi:outer membrane immunogenic protein
MRLTSSPIWTKRWRQERNLRPTAWLTKGRPWGKIPWFGPSCRESLSMKHLMAACLSLCVLASAAASAQTSLPFSFSALPSFAWPDRDPATGRSRWEGTYARMSTGFEVSSSKRFGTVAGPTIGFEGGKLWRDGSIVYGVAGGFDYLAPFGNSGTPAFGRMAYTRDLAGGFQAKVGTLVTEDVLLYARAGLGAVNETFRVGPSPVTPGFSRQDIAIRPEAGVGVEWAVTDRLTLGIEVGTTGRALH